MSVHRESKESLWMPVPLRGDVKAQKACLSPCSGHAVHPAYLLILIFKYRPKPSCKLTSYMSESAIQTLCGAQLFSWAHWHYQILLQTNSRSSRNALSAHITKALHWHLERKLSMLTIQIKHQQKTNDCNGLTSLTPVLVSVLRDGKQPLLQQRWLNGFYSWSVNTAHNLTSLLYETHCCVPPSVWSSLYMPRWLSSKRFPPEGGPWCVTLFFITCVTVS